MYRICTVLSKIQQPEHVADYLEDYNSNCTSNNQKQKEHKASIGCQLHIVQGRNTAVSDMYTCYTLRFLFYRTMKLGSQHQQKKLSLFSYCFFQHSILCKLITSSNQLYQVSPYLFNSPPTYYIRTNSFRPRCISSRDWAANTTKIGWRIKL